MGDYSREEERENRRQNLESRTSGNEAMMGIYVIMRCIEDGLHEVSIRELSQVFYIIRKMCGDGELYIRAQRDGGRIENEIRSMIRFLSSVICHLGVFYMHFIRERDF